MEKKKHTPKEEKGKETEKEKIKEKKKKKIFTRLNLLCIDIYIYERLFAKASNELPSIPSQHV